MIRPATLAELEGYVSQARAAQAWLRARGLAQYVPAAHPEYAAAIRERVANGTLFALSDAERTSAWFSLDPAPSPWWPADGARASYLAGIVVSGDARGRGIGREIVRWSAAEAGRRGCALLRLDCHSGNRWLCAYYESLGFALQGEVEQHPGYFGCLYQLTVSYR
ncbi:MAG TPA: GNAT family N-acetyltransferase [Myxococcota bacterium]|nr:GNAT family N-acetyltransferase [Myxococcota bacterium]